MNSGRNRQMKQYKKTAEYIKESYDRQIDESIAHQMIKSEKIAMPTSQWRLMWRKYIRNRIAVVGGIIVALFYLTALFADFIAPYSLDERMVQYSFLPPQRIYFFAEGRFQPHVLALETGRDPITLQRTYVLDPEKRIPIRFFVQGKP